MCNHYVIAPILTLPTVVSGKFTIPEPVPVMVTWDPETVKVPVAVMSTITGPPKPCVIAVDPPQFGGSPAKVKDRLELFRAV
jgi:hypothetical protein